MRYALIFLAALSVILGGCESQPGQNGVDATDARMDTLRDTTAGDVQGPGDGETEDGSAALGVSLQVLLDGAESRNPDTQQLSILDRLNEPQRVSIDTQVNRHQPGQTDTLRTLHYDGARLTVYEVTGGKELMKNVTVTGSGLESPEGVRVGMTRGEVENILGEPSERQNMAYVYVEDAPMPVQFYVYFENDDVSRMEWLFPID